MLEITSDYDRYPTRSEAINRIYDLINSGLFEEELESDLVDICNCIEAEKMAIDIWGAKYGHVNEIFQIVKTEYLEPSEEEQRRILEHNRLCNQVIEMYGYIPISCGYDAEKDELVERIE